LVSSQSDYGNIPPEVNTMSAHTPSKQNSPPPRMNPWQLTDPIDLLPAQPPMSWSKVAMGLAVTAILLPPLVAGNTPGVRTFALVFLSIVLEALPFMLIGACAGGLIEVFISRERLTSLLPKRAWAVTCTAAAMGLVFPVCECAVVPVVRRLARKGLPLSASVAYLLGGPIVNPIVAASTLLAYKFDWMVVIVRLGVGYLIAVSVGLLMGWIFSWRQALLDSGTHHHEHTTCGCGHDHGAHGHTARISHRLVAAIRHASDDFFSVAHYLIIGAAIAALAQTMLERRTVLEFAALPILPSLAMILLAILLNLCSEADAFIAASFRGLLPLPAQLAFMLTGPMFDLKLLLMYRTLFTRRAIIALASLILLVVSGAVILIEMSGVLTP
jgi:uncharacterized protein